jgi:8-oxo-dGTP pyrophosphatase MutT (NUDIX family)
VTGRVEEGETLEEAARREALEEVGLRVSVGAEVFRCAAVGAPFELVWFRATLEGCEEAGSQVDTRVESEEDAGAGVRVDEREESGEDAGVRIQADEVAEARWCTPAEVEALEPMFDETRRFLARQALPGELR